MSDTSLAELLTKRIPPHNGPAERAVLGAGLLDGGPAVDRVAGRIQADDFYLDRHRRLWQVLAELHEAGQGIDLVTAASACRAHGWADDLPPAFLAQLVDEASTLTAIESHAELILTDSARRRTIQACTEAIGRAYDGQAPAELSKGLIDAVGEAVERTEAPTAEQRRVSVRSLAEILDDLQASLAVPTDTFLKFPLQWCNKQMGGGLKPGEFLLWGGLPGSGKTAAALELATFTARVTGPVLLLSLEMDGTSLVQRIVSQEAKIPALSLRRGVLSPDEQITLASEAPRIGAFPIWIDDQSHTLGAIKRVVREQVEQHGVVLVVIDYLQLIQGPESKDRRLEVAAISRTLKRLGRRHRVGMVALSSLTPPPQDGGKPKRPSMRNLRETRDLDHDADWILLLHQPGADACEICRDIPKQVRGSCWHRELILDKARHGITGLTTLDYQGSFLHFRELETGRIEEV